MGFDRNNVCFSKNCTVCLDDGFVGGNYASSYASTGQASGYTYARLLTDKGGEYSILKWYDRMGRLIISQNTKQHNYNPPAYGYSIYDPLGRVVETGQKTENTDAITFNTIFGDTILGFTNPTAINYAKYLAWLKDNTGVRSEVTHTYFDIQDILPTSMIAQQNLRNRVASVTYSHILNPTDSTKFDNALYYSYDAVGNVSTLVKDDTVKGIGGQRYKRADYLYDLISQNVNEVDFQSGQLDQYHTAYRYDADKRILSVSTSRDSVLWDNDANYFHYAHNRVARIEIGDQQVQGMDYAYTLQGWFKGVNSDQLDGIHDMGHDALQQNGNFNRYFARDAIGYTMNYFDKSSQYYRDYDAINKNYWNTVPNRFEAYTYGSDLMRNRYDFFNGNIGIEYNPAGLNLASRNIL